MQADFVTDPPIDDYAAIGDGHTLALVSRHGGVDWLCVPDFSSPSVFAALLDREHGGCFMLRPNGEPMAGQQKYRGLTNIVETTFDCAGGRLEVIDFMASEPPDTQARGVAASTLRGRTLVRIARCTHGSVALMASCRFRPGYAAEPIALKEAEPCRWQGLWEGGALVLQTTHLLALQGTETLLGTIALQAGETFEAVLTFADAADDVAELYASPKSSAQALLTLTERRWAKWVERYKYKGPWHEEVLRSALALKLLNYTPSGAIVAAGTTSIPEGPHGHRNWDYRFCWLRDTSLVLQALMDLGYTAESAAFLEWLLKAARDSSSRVQVLYDIHGRPHIPEQTVQTLRGYQGIGPVHVGNDAMHQLQLDIYGELLLTAHDFICRGGKLAPQECSLLEGFVEVVCQLWREPDEGIWEVRAGKRQNTHSKVMCWAALDRGLKLCDQGVLNLNKVRVTAEREAIREKVETCGFDIALDSYVGYFGGKDVDAALLLMPRLGYIAYDDPRMLGTVKAIQKQLAMNGLLYRYPPGPGYDGVPGQENLFCICSFWLVECLARQGKRQEAISLFEHLLSIRNHAGLYAEEFEVKSLRPVGNFPQAFSHVGMITAAMALAETSTQQPVFSV